jgi:hypothetical protein
MNPLTEYLTRMQPVDVEEDDTMDKMASVMDKLPSQVLRRIVEISNEPMEKTADIGARAAERVRENRGVFGLGGSMAINKVLGPETPTIGSSIKPGTGGVKGYMQRSVQSAIPKTSSADFNYLVKEAEAGNYYAIAYLNHMSKFGGIGVIGRGVSQLGKLWKTFRSGGLGAVKGRLSQQAYGQGTRKVLMSKVKELRKANPNLTASQALHQAKKAIGPRAMYAPKSYLGLAKHYAPALGVVGGAAAVPVGLSYAGARLARRDQG